MTKQRLHGIVLTLALGLTTASLAESGPEPSSSGLRRWAEQDYMFGDWGGLRTDLSKRGIDFEFFYATSLPDNLAGGLHTGGLYQGGLLMTLDVDSQKLIGYAGGTFHASGLSLHGEKPFSDNYVGDLNKVNMLDLPNSARLWELWYQQKFLGGKLALKVGELSIDRDFVVPELYNSLGAFTLINQTFFFPTLAFNVYDIPGFPPHHHGLASTPNAAPGAVLRWGPVPSFYAQAGVYGGDPDQTYSGTRFNLSETEGALAYFELGYHLNQQTNDTGLEGSYKLGAFYHTGEFADVYDGVTSVVLSAAGFPAPDVRNRGGNYGAYFLAEQQVFRERDKADPAKQGLIAFFRLEGAPSDRNLTQFGINGGLVYRGLIPGRDWDTLALGLSYLEMSDDIRRAQQDANALASGFGLPSPFEKLADYEGVIELSYKIQMTAWWTLQPSLQRVLHPGGYVVSTTPDAWVGILQTTLRF
jgi:porin